MTIFSEGAAPDGQGGECSAGKGGKESSGSFPMRPGSPLTKQRSPWQPMPMAPAPLALLSEAGALDIGCWLRKVNDGELTAILSRNPPQYLWHLSVSHSRRQSGTRVRKAARYPTWDELAHARYELLPGDMDVRDEAPADQ